MPDIAVVSVISSAAVGVAGLMTQAWTSHRAREHEGELAREQREVEEGRAAQDRSVELAQWCVGLAHELERPSMRLLSLAIRPWDLDAKLAVHGPAEVASALARFDALMQPFLTERIYPLVVTQASKEQAVNDGDFEKAASVRAEEVEMLKEGEPDLDQVKAALAEVRALLAPKPDDAERSRTRSP